MLLLNLPADAETKIVPFQTFSGHHSLHDFKITQMGEGWSLVAIIELQSVAVQSTWDNNGRHKDEQQVVAVKGALLCRTKNAAEADEARCKRIEEAVLRNNQYKFDNLEHATKKQIEEAEKKVTHAEGGRDLANVARATVEAALEAAEAGKRKMEEDLAKIRKAVGERVWKETVG